MSFDNNYPNRKDKRKKYYRSKSFDRSCRPAGACPWCRQNRLISRIKLEIGAKEDINNQGVSYE